MTHPLLDLPNAFRSGHSKGLPSVCSAHPIVIEAALREATEADAPVLIEATCNQVNQDGGYTGMTPAAFRAFVEEIADLAGCPRDRIILGGDHLGPNPWRHLPSSDAMDKAEAMIAAYAAAGFTKLHLDTSMGCDGEPAALPDTTTAERAARLAAVAEANKASETYYVIGTEVPVPGGATHALASIEPTTPEAALQTHAIHAEAFARLGLDDAFDRVIGLVVQPGVEFGHSDVVRFDPEKAAALSACLHSLPGVIFEAHSTDYQSPEALTALVASGLSILKVGPGLTFALRQALYGLDAIADILLDGRAPQWHLMAEMDRIMAGTPGHWESHYAGTDKDKWIQRHFSYSDRIRYYWTQPDAQTAVQALMDRLADRDLPLPLLAQFCGALDLGTETPTAHDVRIAAVRKVLKDYRKAAMS